LATESGDLFISSASATTDFDEPASFIKRRSSSKDQRFFRFARLIIGVLVTLVPFAFSRGACRAFR